ncbi:MAG: MM0924 family protein [Vampirovibrionia bacterium]
MSCNVEKFLNGCLIGKNIEVYCGGGQDVYYGVAKEATDSILTLEKDNTPIYVVIDKIQSICLAK